MEILEFLNLKTNQRAYTSIKKLKISYPKRLYIDKLQYETILPFKLFFIR